jgi:poly(3-hydroxybutyrate) depolymerase
LRLVGVHADDMRRNTPIGSGGIRNRMTKRFGGALLVCLLAGFGVACTPEEEAGTTGTAGTTGGGAGTTGAAGTGSSTGTAGTTGAAGTGSATGTAGTTGAAGTGSATGGAGTTGGAGSGGLPGAVKTAGCGMEPPTAQGAPMTYTKYTIMVGTNPRDYWIWLPANYDKSKAYPTVFIGPGCGGRGNQGIPMFKASGDKAVLIGLDASPKVTGRDCFMTESPTSPELPYFDAVVAEVSAKLCLDKAHFFMEGFSSGSWLANLLGCARGNVIKAQGNASGCTPPLPTCTGPIAMMGVTNDPDPNNSYQCGMQNRDRIATLNGCTKETMPYDPGPMVKATNGGVLECTQFKGCMPGKPVVWCRTTNLGHNDGSNTGISTFGFWDFWMSLP